MWNCDTSSVTSHWRVEISFFFFFQVLTCLAKMTSHENLTLCNLYGYIQKVNRWLYQMKISIMPILQVIWKLQFFQILCLANYLIKCALLIIATYIEMARLTINKCIVLNLSAIKRNYRYFCFTETNRGFLEFFFARTKWVQNKNSKKPRFVEVKEKCLKYPFMVQKWRKCVC